jgi:hypothetical protein|tara:strand:- start:110 stop:265 length:156 start_codon:yes stop_codon:yes gene_type:complete
LNTLKKIFCIKDLNYFVIILTLILTLIATNLENKKDYEWCDYFLNEFTDSL